MLIPLQRFNESVKIDKNVNLESKNNFFESLFDNNFEINKTNYMIKNDFICYGSSLYTGNSDSIDQVFCNGSRFYNNKHLPPLEQLSKNIFLSKTDTNKTVYLKNVYIFNKTNNWTNKFFHFITDLVLKTQLLDKKYSDTVLLTTDIKKPFLNILKKIVKDKKFKIILASSSTKYICNSSYLLSSPVDLYGHISKSQLDYLDNLFSTLKTKKNKKIYLARSSALDPVSFLPQRVILNEHLLIGALKKNGFKIIYPEKMSIYECSSHVRGAECIVSGHGSQLTNIIFAKPGTKIIEIMPENYFSKSLACYRAISAIKGLKYHYINGLTPEKYFYNGPRFKNNKEVCTSNMFITKNKIDLIVQT